MNAAAYRERVLKELKRELAHIGRMLTKEDLDAMRHALEEADAQTDGSLQRQPGDSRSAATPKVKPSA